MAPPLEYVLSNLPQISMLGMTAGGGTIPTIAVLIDSTMISQESFISRVINPESVALYTISVALWAIFWLWIRAKKKFQRLGGVLRWALAIFVSIPITFVFVMMVVSLL
ncbi:MAG: hypothetical protein GY894_04680 [Planctomycetes bacterium]|jgi:hypothetical protein|nr:hypothetical protein [Planctomycetota bacterium]MCP4838642.1 hypothetical protein [Planctomycetota bacterium]